MRQTTEIIGRVLDTRRGPFVVQDVRVTQAVRDGGTTTRIEISLDHYEAVDPDCLGPVLDALEQKPIERYLTA